MQADPRPFAGSHGVRIVLPAGDDPEIRGLRELIIRESAEFAVDLPAPVTFRLSRTGPATGGASSPTMYVGPASHNDELRSWQASREIARAGVPYAEFDGNVVAVDGPNGVSDVAQALSLLRTAVRSGARRSEARPADTPASAVDRLVSEIGWTYPAFQLRGIDWPELVAKWRPRAERSGAELPVLRRWVAELRDPHTSVRAAVPRGLLPYTACVDGSKASVRLGHVPRWSAGWRAGARPGDTVLAVGAELDTDDLIATSAGEHRTRGWFAGRQAMTVIPPGEVTVEARTSAGAVLRWTEHAGGEPWPEPVSWSRLPSGTGYLRIRGWLADGRWADAVEAAFDELSGCPRLIVDVRGNVGGNLVAALSFRDRFLTERTVLGTIRFSVGDGTLSPPAPIHAEPADGRRWHRPVTFLLDSLSYSATEDALLGLRDLAHVRFLGEPSGGGSGRPRSVLLQDGVVLSVSTALTFECSGRCVEGNGLSVDAELPADALRSGRAVDEADSSW